MNPFVLIFVVIFTMILVGGTVLAVRKFRGKKSHEEAKGKVKVAKDPLAALADMIANRFENGLFRRRYRRYDLVKVPYKGHLETLEIIGVNNKKRKLHLRLDENRVIHRLIAQVVS